MKFKSSFLFDDREYLLFGSVVTTEAEYVDTAVVAEMRKNRHPAIKYIAAAAASTVLGLMPVAKIPIGSSPAHIPIKSSARVGQEQGDDLRKSFVSSRNFLGLKQAQVAQILGLSESTIEKFEQGIYPTNSEKTMELISAFNMWTNLLQEHHGDRRFIVRPFIKVKMNALGNKSPLDYATENPGSGLLDLIGLERKMHG